MLAWIDFSNGDTLQTIREKINNFSTAVRDKVNTQANTLTSLGNQYTNLSGEVTTNSEKIEAVEDDITTLQENEVLLDNRVQALEEVEPIYLHSKVNNFIVTSTVFETVTVVTKEAAPEGTYRLDMAQLFTLDTTTNSAHFRYSTDNGLTWIEVRKEPKDVTDITPVSYFTHINHTSGDINILIQARKESTNDNLEIVEMNISLEKKL